MKRLLLLPASALLLLAAPAFGQDQPGHQNPAPGTANEDVSTAKDAASHAAGTVSAVTTTSLNGFVNEAALSDMYEVEAGKLAGSRSANPDVKAFAQRMVTAHTQTTEKLKSLVAGNPAVKIPTSFDNRRQMLIDELRAAKDADFDLRYMSQQVDAHKEALRLMNNYAKKGDNMSVKAFASDTATAVQAHLDSAQKTYQALPKS